ncbi:hypothetical protein ROHU_028335 [Labeo rohita]|uniref:Uncharacterized protein n=1 Tax=Labeo rohita TaxID=84645 RepID=A0A498M559_LABRO|nr:hypothetical protein ROHU_028335 [Labeo rohita]
MRSHARSSFLSARRRPPQPKGEGWPGERFARRAGDARPTPPGPTPHDGVRRRRSRRPHRRAGSGSDPPAAAEEDPQSRRQRGAAPAPPPPGGGGDEDGGRPGEARTPPLEAVCSWEDGGREGANPHPAYERSSRGDPEAPIDRKATLRQAWPREGPGAANSRSWLRSSSTHEPSDPPLRVVLFWFEVKAQTDRKEGGSEKTLLRAPLPAGGSPRTPRPKPQAGAFSPAAGERDFKPTVPPDPRHGSAAGPQGTRPGPAPSAPKRAPFFFDRCFIFEVGGRAGALGHPRSLFTPTDDR